MELVTLKNTSNIIEQVEIGDEYLLLLHGSDNEKIGAIKPENILIINIYKGEKLTTENIDHKFNELMNSINEVIDTDIVGNILFFDEEKPLNKVLVYINERIELDTKSMFIEKKKYIKETLYKENRCFKIFENEVKSSSYITRGNDLFIRYFKEPETYNLLYEVKTENMLPIFIDVNETISDGINDILNSNKPRVEKFKSMLHSINIHYGHMSLNEAGNFLIYDDYNPELAVYIEVEKVSLGMPVGHIDERFINYNDPIHANNKRLDNFSMKRFDVIQSRDITSNKLTFKLLGKHVLDVFVTGDVTIIKTIEPELTIDEIMSRLTYMVDDIPVFQQSNLINLLNESGVSSIKTNTILKCNRFDTTLIITNKLS